MDKNELDKTLENFSKLGDITRTGSSQSGGFCIPNGTPYRMIFAYSGNDWESIINNVKSSNKKVDLIAILNKGIIINKRFMSEGSKYGRILIDESKSITINNEDYLLFEQDYFSLMLIHYVLSKFGSNFGNIAFETERYILGK